MRQVLLQAQLAQLQADRDRLDIRATAAERDYAAASSELEDTKLTLKVKLEEQQNQFRVIEEEQYGDWEKRVKLTYVPAWLSLVSCCPERLFCHNAAVLLHYSCTGLLATLTGFGGWLVHLYIMKACIPTADFVSLSVFTLSRPCKSAVLRSTFTPIT